MCLLIMLFKLTILETWDITVYLKIPLKITFLLATTDNLIFLFQIMVLMKGIK